MTAICFDHVTKSFPGNSAPAVFDCQLEVETASLVVLLGPSGSGKTTLLKMVNRLVEPTSGTVLLDDVDVREIEVTLLRRQIGYVIQQVGLFPHMTVAQNIAVVPELLKWPRDKIEARVDELLNLVGLPAGEYRRRYPSQLSGGQAQRVGLARALAADPQVMLMDEPFGAIDAITRTSLQDEMVRLQRMLKKTILFVTHDVEEALRLADKIAVLRNGRVVQYDTPFNLLRQPADAFVHELIGAGDSVRQLSLLRVEAVMEPLPSGSNADGAPTIPVGEDLRQALSILLRSGAPYLTVIGPEGPVGVVSLDRIRLRAQEEPR
jgi:osmoprotectant transport system ATP-binding protein